jgi:hypothetical protein
MFPLFHPLSPLIHVCVLHLWQKLSLYDTSNIPRYTFDMLPIAQSQLAVCLWLVFLRLLPVVHVRQMWRLNILMAYRHAKCMVHVLDNWSGHCHPCWGVEALAICYEQVLCVCFCVVSYR